MYNRIKPILFLYLLFCCLREIFKGLELLALMRPHSSVLVHLRLNCVINHLTKLSLTDRQKHSQTRNLI